MTGADAFLRSAPLKTTTTTTTTTVPHMALPFDPNLLADGAVAMVSLAAGAWSQQPRLQALREELNATQLAAATEIAALQERLYALDEEYEQGTAALKAEFDALRISEVQRAKRKQAQEFQYTLQARLQALQDEYEAALDRQRATLKTQQYQQLQNMTADATDQRSELLQLRIQSQQWNERNQKLQQLYQQAQEEIIYLKQRDKNRWTKFFESVIGNNNNNNHVNTNAMVDETKTNANQALLENDSPSSSSSATTVTPSPQKS